MTHDTDAPELLPCPWCGPVTSIDFGHEMGAHSVLSFRFCVGCGAQGPNQRTEIGAIAAWNTRATPAAQARHAADERIRVLTEALQLVWDTYGMDPSIDSAIWRTVMAALDIQP